MNEPIASIVMRGSPYDWYAFPILIIAVPIVFAVIKWRFFVQWLEGIKGRKWPDVPAIIDNVSVVEERHATGRGDIVYYIATLTYFYRNPDLQTGDYSRSFDGDAEDEAKSWANSYKGSAVKVHVDPRDPSRSVLRKEDL